MYLSGTTMCRSQLRGVAHPQTPVAPAPRAKTATDSGSRKYPCLFGAGRSLESGAG
jgi:hypothetical protein